MLGELLLELLPILFCLFRSQKLVHYSVSLSVYLNLLL